MNQSPELLPDSDSNHAETASNQAYLEVLPDTRVTHDDKLTNGVNFTNEPGEMAVLSYKIDFNTTGRYYVWVRAFSTGTEDNGVHVGIDNQWPESGRRMQWCEGKNQWTWASKQRTEANHCGEPYLIFLDVDTKGEHTIQFSMREDGFEFDKFILTTDRDFIPEELKVDVNFGEKATPQSQGNDEVKMLEALDYLTSKSFQDGIEEEKHSIYFCSSALVRVRTNQESKHDAMISRMSYEFRETQTEAGGIVDNELISNITGKTIKRLQFIFHGKCMDKRKESLVNCLIFIGR
ncbi:MAG: hypothetical protein U5K79_07615 [Cyclobacteriaceae bacterium]|nr:hypothetical protein [Cyclobacteriaceae bacterium]